MDIIATLLAWLVFAGATALQVVFVVVLGLTADPCVTTDTECVQEMNEVDQFVARLGVLIAVTCLMIIIGQVWFGFRRRYIFWWPLLGIPVLLVGAQIL